MLDNLALIDRLNLDTTALGVLDDGDRPGLLSQSFDRGAGSIENSTDGGEHVLCVRSHALVVGIRDS